MKRKLVNYEVFQKINEASLTVKEKELIEAADVIASVINENSLKLYCFNESTVTYETLKKSYIHASYHLAENNVYFENIQELVIDESSAKEKSLDVLRKMFDEILNAEEAKANESFKEYISLPFVRKNLLEGSCGEPMIEKKSKKKKKRKMIKMKFSFGDKDAKLDLGAKDKRKIKEWMSLTENVFSYLDYQEFGPIARQSELQRDEKGNVVALKIPNAHTRNEGKILSFNWKTLNTDVEVLRSKMKNLAEDVNFCRAMGDLRQCNAISDEKKLEFVLEAVVKRWPNVIYLTQSELAKTISTALETSGASNYDDQTCEFMAEGILRTATEAYSERVEKLMKLSGIKYESTNDVYLDFQKVADKFFGYLDKNVTLEMQVFVDLYNSLTEVHKLAAQGGNVAVQGEAVTYLRELKSVIDQAAEPTLELADEVASWLVNLIETNLETQDWNVSNTPYITTNGSNPEMEKIAKKGYSPAADSSGDWGSELPVSDGKSYKSGLDKEMRNSWGNYANKDTYPDLRNPLEKGSDTAWTMPKDTGVDKDNGGLVYDGGKDAWPELKNIYCPSSVTPQTYKAKSDDLIVDK